ncbi:homocysteine S-methyltransferase family protein [Mailhella sp.]|uniref:homocysteine S-methyltransferase family protein n=1 Tax=Mailhella sp. TaxID=1981029 RepID=UPI0040634CAD
MNLLDKIRSSLTYCDGGMGTLLQARGLKPGEFPELWNLSRPQDIIDIHCQYLEAGCNIVTANTFGAYSLRHGDRLESIIAAGLANAREAVSRFSGDRYVAYDMGSLGRMLKPLGDLAFEDAVEVFAQSVRIAVRHGADLLFIETINDSLEAKAAVLAAKENSDLPVFITCVYDAQAKLMTGADPAAMVAMLEGLGVDALGMNCSLGPKQMLPIVPMLAAETSLPLIVNPNAGLPRSTPDGKTVFDVDADGFADCMVEIVKSGACLIGGCCGTTPEYIRKTVEKTRDLPFRLPEPKTHTVVSSYTHAVRIGEGPVLIGERINPTGKARFKQALREGDIDHILGEGVRQQEAGAHILDVNVGLPEIDEPAMMLDVVRELQAVSDLPLQIDTVDPAAMEQAMRICNGKPLVNSVNGKPESMDAVFPLVKKYGGVMVALTIGPDGIPDTAEGRYAIAADIVAKAEAFGISRRDIVVDPLAMAVSSDPQSALVTLESIRLIKERLGVRTSLGVSNISFGLPCRDVVTSAFFALALQNGLDAAIMNPFSVEMMKVYHAFRALHGLDANCADYIAFASGLGTQTATLNAGKAAPDADAADPLKYAVIKGLKEKAGALAAQMAAEGDPLTVVNTQIIPALDVVGKGFEAKTMFLPQLLMSAEAAKHAFEAVKAAMSARNVDSAQTSRGTVVLATVKGDIHDIGKNIVRVLLSNYGYRVLDLGKDVAPQTIVDCALEHDVKLVGLSALMTTTVPAMEETIALLRKSGSKARVVVGGAVLTQEYADMIGADRYAKDAMETVRYAEEIFPA